MKFVARTAERLGADAVVFPSLSQDAMKNPLPFREKVKFLQSFFGGMMNISDRTDIRNPLDAMLYVSRAGYRQVYVVVGSDRVAEFRRFGGYVKSSGGKDDIVLDKYEVIAVPGNRDASASGIAGMSASKLRALAMSGDFKSFQRGVPTRSESLAKQLFQSVRRHMGAKSQIKEAGTQKIFCPYCKRVAGEYPADKMPKTIWCKHCREDVDTADSMDYYTTRNESVFIYGVTPAAASVLRESFEGTIPVRDLSGMSMSEIRRRLREAKNPRIYTRNELSSVLTEGAIRRQATYGMLCREYTKQIVEVRSVTPADAVRDVRKHVTETFGRQVKCTSPKCADFNVPHSTLTDRPLCLTCRQPMVLVESTPGVPKQPSEVDRLKTNQKQQLLLTKQRQSQELLQAKQRELQKKSREDSNKIANGSKPPAVTR